MATVRALRREGLWPPVVPTIVLVECLTAKQHSGAKVNRFLKTCELVEGVPEGIARRAASLRAKARRAPRWMLSPLPWRDPAGMSSMEI
jgi:hypothetical protein